MPEELTSIHVEAPAAHMTAEASDTSYQEAEEKVGSDLRVGKTSSAGLQDNGAWSLADLKYAVSFDMGPRKSMEDCHAVVMHEGMASHMCPHIEGFVTVFNEHNKAQAAKFSSKNLAGFLLQECNEDYKVAAALKSVFQRCDNTLFGQWRGGSFCDSDTTIVACVVASEEHMRLANVGDCRAIRSRSDRAETVTKDS